MATPEEARVVLAAGWFVANRVEPLGMGVINDTFLVDRQTGIGAESPPKSGGGPSERYVLQRLNPVVFEKPAIVVRNVERVLEHLNDRDAVAVPKLVEARSGRYHHVGGNGDYWRLWRYVEGAVTHQTLVNPRQAYAAGRAFGGFQRRLVDLPPPRLEDPIPGFLQLNHYLSEWDRQRRVGETAEAVPGSWMEFIDARRTLAVEFSERDRYIHGDCKINNLLFAAGSDQVACIVDLDTVMWGAWTWDFGDLVRSGAARTGKLDIQLFGELAAGFVSAAGVEAEPRQLARAPCYVTCMLGIRFLTDHLAGDRYFKVRARGDNLTRAQAQFRLLLAMEAVEDAMLEAAERALSRSSPIPE